MRRPCLLTDAQRANVLALPTRKRPETKLGLALQLCALRFPGTLLRPGELIPAEPQAFITEQVGVPSDSLTGFARRGPTRYEQLGLLYRTYSFQELTRPHRAELAAWLLPIARETTAGLPLVEALLGEMRRRRIVVPGISVVERLAAAVLHDAEVWTTITGRLGDVQRVGSRCCARSGSTNGRATSAGCGSPSALRRWAPSWTDSTRCGKRLTSRLGLPDLSSRAAGCRDRGDNRARGRRWKRR
jgi:hypothetical protein